MVGLFKNFLFGMALIYSYIYDVKLKLNIFHKSSLSQHTYITDQDQYGTQDKWVASLVGECEDYALWIQQELKKQNIIGDLWLVMTETNELHVVVLVGNWVIDNRHAKVMQKSDLPYNWLAPVEFYNKINRAE